MSKKRRVKQPIIKKVCSQCMVEKKDIDFYKASGILFPDGRLNICSKCVRESVDYTNLDELISFLRQIDKPYVEKYWNECLNAKNDRHPLAEYIRMTNSLSHLKNKTFEDSDGISAIGKTEEVIEPSLFNTIETETGDTVEYDDSLIAKWGLGYKKREYLQLEKFYQDMILTHEIHTPIHKDMLIQLAKLSVLRNKYLEEGEISDYEKATRAYELLMKSAGFRPVDRKNGADATGLNSFSQVWAEIEKEGFIVPDMIDYPKDDLDYMLLYHVQFAQRLVGKSVSTKPNPNWKNEVIIHDE